MDKVCEGCGRHWSDPIPANCPECGEVFWVMEEQTSEDQAGTDYTGDEGRIHEAGRQYVAEGRDGTYYCGQCSIFHKADSGIGRRHQISND